jgi:pimeloyl-ACP methyl ester carboxylesterase
VIAGGLSGAYCAALAGGSPGLLRALVLSNPPPVDGARPGALRGVADLLLDAPIMGQSVFNLLSARMGIRVYLREQAYSNPDLVTEAMVDAHYAMAHQPHARYAAQAYLAGHLDLDAREAIGSLRRPLLLVFGADAQPAAAAYVRLNPRAHVHLVERCRMYPHEEQAERFLDAVLPWLKLQSAR